MNTTNLFELREHVTILGNPLRATHRWGERLLTEVEAKRVNGGGPVGSSQVQCAHGKRCHETCRDCMGWFDGARTGIALRGLDALTDRDVVTEYERRKLRSQGHVAAVQRGDSLLGQVRAAEVNMSFETNRAETFVGMLNGYEALATQYGKRSDESTRSWLEKTLRANADKLANPMMMVPVGSKVHLPPDLARGFVVHVTTDPYAEGTYRPSSGQKAEALRDHTTGKPVSQLPPPKPVEPDEGHYVLDEDLLCAHVD